MSMPNPEVIKVAVIQAEPVYYDLPQCLAKALSLIQEASQQGAELIVFGETWFSGYPAWLDNCRDVALWNHEPTKALFQKLHANSLAIPSPEIDQLKQIARQLEVVLVLSINEKVAGQAGHGTLFNSLITISSTGEIINHHRKLMPTYTERLVWGAGDAAGLQAVDTQVGRVGGLICWEHWMPLARQTMHNTAEQIHIAVWPTVNDIHQLASRHYALEGRCFVLAAGSILHARSLPADLIFAESLDIQPESLLQKGGSAIIDPTGDYMVGPIYDRETILVAELDLTQCIREGMTLDVTGHYARPDIFELQVNRKRLI